MLFKIAENVLIIDTISAILKLNKIYLSIINRCMRSVSINYGQSNHNIILVCLVILAEITDKTYNVMYLGIA